MRRAAAAMLELLYGCLHFFVVFVCAFNGHNRATVLAVLAYFVVGLVLGHDHPTSYRLRVLFVMLPAVLSTIRLAPLWRGLVLPTCGA